jgi:hypothetical protein
LIEHLPDGAFNIFGIHISHQLALTCGIYPEACAAGLAAAAWANYIQVKLYPDEKDRLEGIEGKPKEGDAFQHCFWSGLTTLAVGPTWAEKVTTRFEMTERPDDVPKPLFEDRREYDLDNNKRGRDYAQGLRESGILRNPFNVGAAYNAILAYCQ